MKRSIHILAVLTALMLCTSMAWGQNGESPGDPLRKPHTRNNEMRATSASAIAVSESTGMTPEQLVNNVFLGDGVHISNVKFNGVNTALTTTNGAQLGTFTADITGYTFPTNFFANGLIMTTGKIATALGPNDTGSESNQLGSYVPPACSELAALIPDYSVTKPAVLEFDFVTVAEHIQFNYVFASEEYPEFAGSDFNDVFGFFVTDMVTNTTQNIALIPGTNIPVAINNIHSATGSSYTSVAAYEQYYHSIPSNSPLMQYDAYVGPFVAEMDVVPCRNYHMKLAIANVGDNAYDSGVFLEAASFTASVLNEVVDFEYTGHQYIVAGCYGADVTFTLPHAVENDSLIVLHYGGSALNGINVELLPDIIEMPAGDSTYTLHITGIDNGQNNNDTLVLTIQYENTVCTTVQEGKIDIYIVQDSGLELSSQNITTCGNLNSMSVNVVYGEATDIQWSPATNLTNPHSLTTGFINPPTGTTQYTVTASDKYGCKTASTTFTVTITELEDENITEHVCQGTHYTDHGFNINANTAGTITQSMVVQTPGSDCSHTLNLTLIVDPTPEQTISKTICDSYTWVDGTQQEYTQSGVYDFVTQTANGCDSTVHLNLTINESKTFEFSAEACNSYTWDGTVYDTPGDKVRNYMTAQGCDSIVTMHLTLGHTITNEFSRTECDSYTWDGTEYTTSNDYVKQYVSYEGCDSIVTMHLTINNSTTGIDTQEHCDSYTWIDGIEYTESNNTATFIKTNADGCDSVVTLNLTINNSNTGIDMQEHCDTYTWIDGVTYTASNNTATHTLTNAAGCDSVVTLNLTIKNATTGIDVQEHCNSYTWIDGVTYTASNNTATHTLPNAAGCDSIVTLNLTINNSNTGIDVQEHCDTYTWIDGIEYTASNNTATHTLTNAAGCDSVVTLNLTINNSNTGIDTQVQCDTYTWIDGIEYTASNNTATHTLTNAAGCDSVVTLNLTIRNSNTGIDVQEHCNSYTWIDGVTYTASNNTATHTLTNAAGCDSVVTLNLTIKNATTGIDVQEHCNSYTWIDGVTYTVSNNTATHTLPNAAGCDSIVTLNLTINNSNTGIDTQEHCDSYTWIDGIEYTSSNNTATQTLTNAAGCDSVVTLNLTINHQDLTGSVTDVACDSYTWNGETYTESGVYQFTTQTTHGCDSLATLNLTMNYSDQSTTSVTECDSYTWNGQTYNESGTYTYPTQTVLGCDSTAILNLTINNSEYPEETQVACETYTWHNTEHTISGDYTYETTTEQGCNRVETLHLTIEHPEYPEFTETACDSYDWHGTEHNASGTYTYETTTQAGCVRIETLYLTVNHSDQSTTEMTECDNYFWNGVNYTQSGQYEYHTQTVLGCDSIAHLDLTINNSEYPVETIKYCDNYLWNGQEYTNSGTYTYQTQTEAGCERVETLNLTIVETPDIVIDGDHFPIGGSETSFSTYNYEIVPQNSATVFDSVTWTMENVNWYLDPHNNGMDVDLHIFTWIPDTVQLIATAYNECGSHTYTFWVHTSYYGIDENESESEGSISVLPNPNNGRMTFKFNDFKDEAMVKVFDNNGNLVETFIIDRNNFRHEMSPKAAGTYHFVITHDGKVTTKKVVIK